MTPATRYSLQWRLSAGMFAVIAITGLIAGALSFLWALHDANEILDGTLKQTTSLVTSGQISLPLTGAQLPGTEPDNDVLVMRLPPRSAQRAPAQAGAFSGTLHDGLQTIAWQGKRWRVLITSLGGGERLAVAQRTEARDEIARHSAERTLLPLAVLVPLLVLFVREVVRRTLAPVSRLAHHIDSNPMTNAASLPDVVVPVEVQPFVHSIKQLLGELTAALSQQQQFVANAAHELRSPIAALRIQATNLGTVVPTGEPRQRLAHLQDGIGRIQHLLEQLLSMARSQTGPAVELAPVNVSAVAKDVLSELVPAAAAKGIDLGMDRVDALVCVDATPFDIATLLRNVVGNALKYCPAQAVVNVSVYREGEDTVVSVEDNGHGIAEEHLPQVFSPFYRVLGTGQSGSGLGLSIVAAIAKRLGGRTTLTMRSNGPGMRFEYRQPASVTRAPRIGAMSKESE